MAVEGRKPSRLLIGNREAEEIDAALRPFLVKPPPDDEPLLPLNMVAVATLFGVRIQRVDQRTLLGVVAEGFED